MKIKLQIIIVLFILLSGFIFYRANTDTYNLAKELEGMDGQAQEAKKSSALAYFLPFIKTDFQKTIDNGEDVTVLLLGYGGGEHSGSLLTDTIILGRMDFATGKVTMMNLPRDLWVDGQKINAIYPATGDPYAVVNTVSELLDIQIDYYLMIDFDGFRQAVDELGGLEIYVETTFDDYNYPRHDNDQIDPGVMHIHFDEGWETMNGERALQYARSRYSLEDGGDFSRSKRQQNVILSFKEKVLETRDLRTLFNVAKVVSSHFETDFPYVEGISLYKYSQDHEITIENKIISSEDYLYSTYNDAGSYILLPANNDWNAIREYFYSESE